MREEARAVVTSAVADAELREHRFAFARYVGQGHEIKLALPDRALTPEDDETLREIFEREYTTYFGRTVPGLDIEILTWTLSLSEITPPVAALSGESGSASTADPSGQRSIHLAESGKPETVPVFDRHALSPACGLKGPAVVREPQTTSLLPEGFAARVNARRDLVLTRERKDSAHVSPRADSELTMQLIWNRLLAVVEEQAQVLIRTALSTTVREAGDLSAGVFDLQGRMLAQAVTGTPGHVNAMAASVTYFWRSIRSGPCPRATSTSPTIPGSEPGICSTSRLSRRCFSKTGRSRCSLPRCMSSTSADAGFRPTPDRSTKKASAFAILPLFRAGEANEDVFEIVRTNVREPLQVVGDLYSLAACNEVGGRRLIETMEEFRIDGLEAVSEHIINASRNAMLEEIRALPHGSYENEMTVDGYDNPVELRAKLTVGTDGIDVDFSGSSRASAYGINVPYTYTIAYASFGIRCIVGSRVPNNAGSLAPIRVTAPEGSILNAPRPCAVAVRHVIGQMLPDVVLGCLDRALPGQVPAEGSSSLWNPMMTGGHGLVEGHEYGNAPPFSVTIFHAGGTGARPGKDGLSATAYPSGVRNTPVEITESVAPLIFTRKEYRIGSGGRGIHNGGDGQVIEIESATGAPFAVYALFDRIDHPARGRGGGENGAPGAVSLAGGRKLKGKGKQIVPGGDRLVLELPGGGGIGEPVQR